MSFRQARCAVTDKIINTVKEWQARPLETVYPIVWLDAIHYKIRENGKVCTKAVYTILGVNLEGRKEVLGLYISESEGANFLASGVDRFIKSWRK